MNVRSDRLRTISIQHGISWDLPVPGHRKPRWLERGPVVDVRRFLYSVQSIRNFRSCPNRVFVDYNYLNWIRAVYARMPPGRNWVIPNFAPTVPPEALAARKSKSHEAKILFARRFQDYRGTRCMAEALRVLLGEYPQVRASFLGEGPDETFLRNAFRDHPRVSISRFAAEDSVQVHLDHDIAVFPSLGSEGTSLSLCEAMAAGCAVVATAVGGMTNMIFDNYNGLMVQPGARFLIRALRRLIDDPLLRQRLGAKAHEVSQSAFGIERWKASWRDVLAEVVSEAVQDRFKNERD